LACPKDIRVEIAGPFFAFYNIFEKNISTKQKFQYFPLSPITNDHSNPKARTQ